MIAVKRGKSSFYVGDSEENPLAEMTYLSSSDEFITIDHTTVSDELKGQSVGKLLLKELVDCMRKENKKIKAVCPFAKAIMEKNEEYADMIY